MRKRNQMKKGIAALLSGVLAFGMTAGVIPGFGDSSNLYGRQTVLHRV